MSYNYVSVVVLQLRKLKFSYLKLFKKKPTKNSFSFQLQICEQNFLFKNITNKETWKNSHKCSFTCTNYHNYFTITQLAMTEELPPLEGQEQTTEPSAPAGGSVSSSQYASNMRKRISKAEKKVKKSLQKLNLEEVPGVNRVSIRQGKVSIIILKY